ncbi:hypothetical protein IWQ57_003407 [Coemansia nantahalensis]|uniref:Uncharacterized protein n=1 Tax=Coemansia nantahalensis TaxID=2789366 RepID=A0ACC1JWZ3_9FUNG|nr:hypothetical protein IWQ57_003407 [Coemansia nantahalensis]
MRVFALVGALAACAAAAPLQVRQGEGDWVNGPTALSSPNVNNGEQTEGVLKSGTSLAGAEIINPVGNTMTEVNENNNVHDNIFQNPTVNLAQDTDGPAVVGSGNRIFRRSRSVNAPAAIDHPTVNNGAMREGSLDAGLSADGATVVNPVGNDLAQVNDNTEVEGNNFENPNWNTIKNNNGPAMAGNGNIFVPVTNEAGAIQFDNGDLLNAAIMAGMGDYA